MKPTQPVRAPRIPLLIVRLVTHATDAEGLAGDMEEEFCRKGGTARARRWLWREAARSVPPLARRRLERVGRSLVTGWASMGEGGMGSLVGDLGYAARQMRIHPGFTAVALLTLAIGIGANAAIFSVLHAVLLRPLPYESPGDLVVVWETLGQYSEVAPSPANFRSWRERASSFTDLAAVRSSSVSLADQSGAEQATIGHVTANLLDVLGVEPVLGRDFVPDDDVAGATPVVLLDHGYWSRRFGADPDAVGRDILLDAVPHTIVGVMPEAFALEFPERQDLWRPGLLTVPAAQPDTASYRWHWIRVIGRRSGHASVAAAQSEMDAIASSLALETPGSNEGWGVRIVPIREQLVGSVRSSLVLLATAVGLVLLIACANVSNLLLARGSSRQREIAIRRAAGASRGRIVRQLLTESMFLAVLGGVAGLALAALLQSGFEAWLPADVPGIRGVRVDANMVLFTLVVAVSTSVLFGLAPAFQGTRADISETLRGARGGTSGAASTAFRSGLLGAQAAIVVFLLIGAGLLTKSAVLLTGRDTGFPIEDRSVFDVALPQSTYQGQPAVAEFAARLQDRLVELPEVASAALTTSLPFGNNGYNFPVWVQGEPEGSIDERPAISFEAVTPGYFPTLGVAARSGRTFTAGDDRIGQRVAVLNESLARVLFGEGDPVGRMVSVSDASAGPWHRVVGVVADFRYDAAATPPPRIYLPLGQVDWVLADLQAVAAIRSGSRVVPGASIRGAVSDLDATLAISGVQSFQELRAQRLAHPRFRAQLFGWFAALAVLLGMVGVYGVVGYATQQRGRELRIRKALGADRFGLLTHVVLVGMRPVLLGIVVGIVAASFASRVLGSFLVDISGTDPTTYAAAAALLVVVGGAACLIPGLRAAAVDPAGVLQSD